MEKSAKSIFKPSLNWLLAFIPITLFMEHSMPDRPVLIFLCAAFSIIPIASLIVQATEQIAHRTGDLAFRPAFSLERGVAVTAEWYRHAGWLRPDRGSGAAGIRPVPSGPRPPYL